MFSRFGRGAIAVHLTEAPVTATGEPKNQKSSAFVRRNLEMVQSLRHWGRAVSEQGGCASGRHVRQGDKLHRNLHCAPRERENNVL